MTVITEQLRDFSPGRQEIPAVRVLVVDDEPLIRWSMTQTLLDKGCSVIEAADGRGTIQALEQAATPIDVVLLDYRLPDSNNLQLLTKIRALSPRSRVVLMTAYGTPEVAAEALRLGAVCFVDKPLEMQEVANLVSRAHGSRPA